MTAIRLVALAFLFPSIGAFAERADHDKPMQIEAQRMTVDDAKKIQILEGNVILTKGTIVIQAERVIITEDQYGFQKGVAFAPPGGLAHFRQKREGKEEYIDGEAERIEYNTRSEVAELFHRAYVKSGEDQVKGDYIWYDSVAEKYLVTAGESLGQNSTPQRVRVLLQPKNKNAPPETPTKKGDNLRLQGASGLKQTPAGE